MSEVTAEAIPNQFIVVFKQHAPEEVRQQHLEWAQAAHVEASAARAESDGPELTGVGEQFNIDTLSGYVGSFDESVKNEIASREEVDYVEPDYVAYATGTKTQKPVPSWGLARISSNKKLPLPLPLDLEYTYYSSAGASTTAYILDTGILTTHEDFGGRARFGFNAFPGSGNTDKNGHGTHVAGTVGGTKYGVAKMCSLVAVKVLGNDGKGSYSGIIQGIEWAVNDARLNNRLNKSVANMSLGGGYSQALNSSVAGAVRTGLTIVVAAGNEGKDASTVSPASEPLAFTIGSIDPSDIKSDFSNYGRCLDLFGPGRNITSAWFQPGNTGYNTISGTSMATPHIAGLALTLIGEFPGQYNTPYAVTNGIYALATRNSRVQPPLPYGTTSLLGFNGL